MDASWVIDELAYAGPEHLDPEFVAEYDRKQGHPDLDPDIDALPGRGVLPNVGRHRRGSGMGIALHRAAGVMLAGGVLLLHDLVYDFRPDEAPSVLRRWMDAASTDPDRGYTAEDFANEIGNRCPVSLTRR